jgi:hypothetical protein
MKAPRVPLLLVCLALGFLLPFFAAGDAHAYTWMIRHGYSGCTPCHTDPSGGGPLAPYGRAQGELLMQMAYGEKSDEASALSGLAWGQIQTSDAVRAGGDFREAYFSLKPDSAPRDNRFITMQADVFADVKLGHFRAEATLGYAPTGDLAAALTNNPQGNVISRDHWLGYEIDDDGAFLVRAGRLAVPFGIRVLEHTLFARVLTGTDIDANQQYGVALSMSKAQLRGELMGILGNFEVHPDDFRERGYSGYLEYAPMNTLALGASSWFTRATRDLQYLVTDYRYQNGAFIRYSPGEPLVLLAEVDSVVQSLTWKGHRDGFAAFVQADIEPIQGLHLMLTGETMNSGMKDEPSSYGAWISMGWFFVSHMDLRVDSVYQSLGSPAGTASATSLLLQFHAYL